MRDSEVESACVTIIESVVIAYCASSRLRHPSVVPSALAAAAAAACLGGSQSISHTRGHSTRDLRAERPQAHTLTPRRAAHSLLPTRSPCGTVCAGDFVV